MSSFIYNLQQYIFESMFVIVFSSMQKNLIKIPPLLLPISQQILTKQSCYLQELAVNHFHDHLSPFIRKQHLQLRTERQIIKPDYPIFIYCNFNQYINNIICTLKSYDEAGTLKRSYLLKYSVVVIDSKDFSERIIKQAEVQKLDKILKSQTAYIGAKQIELAHKGSINQSVQYQKKWSEIIIQKWGKFQSQNFCVYILI